MKLGGIITATFTLIAIPLYFGLNGYAQSLIRAADQAQTELCTKTEIKSHSLLNIGIIKTLASAGHSSEPTCDIETESEGKNLGNSMTEMNHDNINISNTSSEYTIKNLSQAATKPNTATKIQYQILDGKNQPLKDYATVHDKPMHLIIAKTDLSQFKHLHPSINTDGIWDIEANFPIAGDYRLFADFTPTNQNNQILSFDLSRGDKKDYQEQSLVLDKSPSKTTDGYQVKYILPSEITANQEFEYSLEITKNGQKVSLEDYLGAKGHSVILKETTLEYVHTHPINDTELRFATKLSAGKSKIFTQFQIAGKIVTADYALEVAQGAIPKSSTDPSDDSHAH